MPTFNQLVKKGRSDKAYKSKSPVLQKGFNALRNEATNLSAPQKRGVCKTREYLKKVSFVDGLKGSQVFIDEGEEIKK